VARYDPKADPLRAYRIQRRQGGPATYEYETCKVCGAHYRPRAYGAHAKTSAHKKALK
jgi:hypothetical protein